MSEKIILEILASSRGKSQKGDVSKHLEKQKFFDSGLPKGLKTRDENVTGNPVDTLDIFLRQNLD